MTKISIITVTFNSAATLEQSLRSVAQQSYSSVEHIVIDGGSKDGTPAIVAAHGSHVACFVSEPDKGIYDAMNKGVARATGDIIGFLNADDYYADKEVLYRVAQAFEDPTVDACLGDVAFFRSDAPDHIVRRYRSAQFQPNKIAWGWMPAHPALFVRRRLFDEYGPFKIDYRIAGDFEWVARVFRPAKSSVRWLHIPEVLVKMQTGGVSTRGWRSTLLLNQEVMRACRENQISTNWLMLLSKYPAKVLEYVRT